MVVEEEVVWTSLMKEQRKGDAGKMALVVNEVEIA
jgi:hypothetical protein